MISEYDAALELKVRRSARADPCQFARSIDIPGRADIEFARDQAAQEEIASDLLTLQDIGGELPPAGEIGSDDYLARRSKPTLLDARDLDERIIYSAPSELEFARHHRLIMEGMEWVSSTPYGRIMFLMPPGSAKSTYASVVFPSRYLGMRADRKLILASYGGDLARRMGRRTRALIQTPRYRGITGCTLSKESGAADEFALTNRSEYLAGGLLTGLTGNRAHGLIVDDPIKGREAARSEVIRQKVWEAYRDDACTRLLPGGWIAMILTHWSEDDPAGRILPEKWSGQSGDIKCRDGKMWRVICLQARCEVDNDPLGRERGEYLWPEWFTAEHWSQFEHEPRIWTSLFQQLPSPPEGGIFKIKQLVKLDRMPEDETFRIVRGWDLGATTRGNWTVGCKLAIGRKTKRLIIMHVKRMRHEPGQRDAEIRNTCDWDRTQHGTRVMQSFPRDPGQAGISQELDFSRKLHGHRLHFSPETGDKETRAEPIASQVNLGNVGYLADSEWNEPFIEVLRQYVGEGSPSDDDVDALSRAYALILERGSGMRISDDLVNG